MRATLGLLLLAGTAAGQRTWVVDVNNGPGTDHTTIQAAVDAARSGDILHIRTGSYDGFVMTKGLRLLAQNDVTVRTGLGIFGKPIDINGLTAGEVAVLSGFTIHDWNGIGRLTLVNNNQGTVQFESIRFLAASGGTVGEAVRIWASAGVSFQRCEVQNGIDASTSAVMLTECSLQRYTNPMHIMASRPAVRAYRSRVTLAQCFLKGQDGALPYNLPQPGLQSVESYVRITGLSQSAIRAGIGASYRVPAVLGDKASTLVLDPRPTLVPSGGANGHEGFGTVTAQNLTFLSVHGGQLGSQLILGQHGAAREFFATWLSLPRAPLQLPPLGDLWLEPSFVLLVLAGIYDSSGQVLAKFPVPSDIRLRGIPLGWQVASGPWPKLAYSNAVFTTLH